MGLKKLIEEDLRRNSEDMIRGAIWNAEMVKKLGRKWFEIRDRWLNEASKDRELWRDPMVREALIRAILAKDRISTSKTI
jgi:hypothetical protein